MLQFHIQKFQPVMLASCLVMLVSGCGSGKAGPDAGVEKRDASIATEEKEDDIIDSDYCFRLKSPGQQWKLMKEAEIQGISPDAVAGAGRVGGTYGVIIVEPVGNAKLQDYAELMQNNSTEQGHQVGSLKPVEILGRKAVGYSMKADIKGMQFQYHNLVFLHQKYGYQLATWGLEELYQPSHSEEFHKAFSLTEGKVQSRSKAKPLQDFQGVGQRVVNGRFESAVSGIATTSSQDWTVTNGAELAQRNSDAEVELFNAKNNHSIVIISEDISHMGADDYRRTIYSMFEEEGAGFEKLPEKVTYSVGGQPVEFSQYAEDAGLKIRNQVGVIVRGDRGFQIVCNGLDWQAGTLQRSISQGLNQIDFLTATEIQKLTEEMLAQPDPENAVGPDWGLRDGVYRDFALGMIWRKPKGFWKLSVGDAAQLQNPDTCIIAEELRYGLVMEVIEKSADERDLETFHRDITEYIFDGPVESVETEIGGQPALSSSGLPLVGEQDYEFCVVTSLHNDRAFQFIVWGAPKHMKEYGQEVENALAGFEFPSREMRATRQTATSYEDNRLGFGLKLSDSSWRIQGNKNAEISPIGNSVEFARHDRNVQVSAFASLEPGQDNITLKLHQQIITANFNRFTKMKPNEIVTSFGGLTWKQKSWTADLDSIYYLSALKNHTFFALFILDESGKGEWLLKEVKAGFQLLDDAKP